MGSLWSNAGVSLFEDHRATRLGDVITVLIAEKSDATRDASTSTSRESDTTMGVGAFFGTLANYPPIGRILFVLKLARPLDFLQYST